MLVSINSIFSLPKVIILLDLVECIQNNFEQLWNSVEDHLKNVKKYLNGTISAVKRDIEIIILQTLENLAKVIDFEQLDGYIDTVEEEITAGREAV